MTDSTNSHKEVANVTLSRKARTQTMSRVLLTARVLSTCLCRCPSFSRTVQSALVGEQPTKAQLNADSDHVKTGEKMNTEMNREEENTVSENSTTTNPFKEDVIMSEYTRNRRDEQEVPDVGASIFAGAVFCLALFGGYKLLKQEMNQPPAIGSGIDSELLQRLLEQELKS